MGNHSAKKTPPELVVAVCVLGATTAYFLALAQRRDDICAALFQFEKKYWMKFPTMDFVDDFQEIRKGFVLDPSPEIRCGPSPTLPTRWNSTCHVPSDRGGPGRYCAARKNLAASTTVDLGPDGTVYWTKVKSCDIIGCRPASSERTNT
jgi:hypothetical protein